MNILVKIALLILVLSFPSRAQAQAVQQSGTVTPSSVPVWITNGVIGGGNTAADSPVTTFGVTSNTTAGLCVSSGRSTAAGRQQLCLGAPLSGNAIISLQNYGTATAKNLCFNINGTQTCIPTSGSGTLPTITTPLVNLDYICADGTAGAIKDCTWKQAAGAANQIPYWSSATQLSNVSAAANGVLITSSGSVPSISSTLPSAVQTNITSVGTVTTGVWSATPITVTGGGTGAATLASHGVVIGQGTSPVTTAASATVGFCLLSQGASSDPIFASCASGTGSAGGSDTQVQYNNASTLAGSANFTWVSPKLTLGVNATTTGQLALAYGGASGQSITIQNLGAVSAYNFNLPINAGTTGQPLVSGGGVSTSMAFQTLGVFGGGTNCSAASGTCVDNISGFSSTGYINRTGAGAYTFSPQITLGNGGTSANLTASNGGIFYSTASAGAILSGTATANQVLVSGANSAPAWSTATYPATTTINQLLYSSATNTVTGLTTANNGILVTGGTGIPSIGSTIPSAVQLNITSLGTISTGVWQATPVALLYGGTNAALTASNGGIFYSTASAGAILSGTATASLPMLSAASSAPTWATISYPTSATSGGIPYFSSTSVMASSGLLTNHGIILGAGAGAAPTALAVGTTGQILTGVSTADPAWTTATYPATAASGTILAAGSTNVITATATPGIGTSLAVGGCTISTDALCVGTGTSKFTGAVTVSAASFGLSGNISAAAWTTTGIRYKNVSATFTDTSSSGTVATAYTNVFGANTIAASSSTTFTNYFNSYYGDPIAGTNVTLTNKWAIGADSAKIGTSNQLTISTAGVLTATSPVFTTPTLGVATATTLNGNTFTTGTYTLTGTAGKTLTFQNSIVLTGTDSTTMTFPSSSANVAALNIADQTLSGGANVTSSSQGTKSSGTYTVDCGASPLQYITNGGAFTLAAPSNDGSCIVRSVNNGSAGTITFSGFTVGSNTGDALTTTNTQAFAINIWRINGVSRYLISAYQ